MNQATQCVDVAEKSFSYVIQKINANFVGSGSAKAVQDLYHQDMDSGKYVKAVM